MSPSSAILKLDNLCLELSLLLVLALPSDSTEISVSVEPMLFTRAFDPIFFSSLELITRLRGEISDKAVSMSSSMASSSLILFTLLLLLSLLKEAAALLFLWAIVLSTRFRF